MDLLTELKKRADANGDGKINASDLEDLKGQFGEFGGTLDNLKGLADSNGDGKIDVKDAQGVLDKLNVLGAITGAGTGKKKKGSIFDTIGGLFGKK